MSTNDTSYAQPPTASLEMLWSTSDYPLLLLLRENKTSKVACQGSVKAFKKDVNKGKASHFLLRTVSNKHCTFSKIKTLCLCVNSASIELCRAGKHISLVVACNAIHTVYLLSLIYCSQ